MFRLLHVDEVDDDDAAEIGAGAAASQWSRPPPDWCGRMVSSQISVADESARVDVDGVIDSVWSLMRYPHRIEHTLRSNLEAAVTIARQLRLRNLGGIIIIDFIDMEEPEHRRQVIQALERALSDESREDEYLVGIAPGTGRNDAQANA